MLIGELSRRSGFSRDTIRYYEKIGLIKLGRHDRRENGYKEYSEDVLDRLLMTRELKAFGFTLAEIGTMLDRMEAESTPCEGMPDLLATRIDDLEEQIARLKVYRGRLVQAQRACDGSCPNPFTDAGCFTGDGDDAGGWDVFSITGPVE